MWVVAAPGRQRALWTHLASIAQDAAEWRIVMLGDGIGIATGPAHLFDAGAIDVIPRSVLDARVLARIGRWTTATGRLQRQERKVRALLQGYLETKSIGVVTIDREGTILFANASLEQMFGYERGELRSRRIETIVPPAKRGRYEAHLAGYWSRPDARPTSRRLEIAGWRKDGSELAIEAVLSRSAPAAKSGSPRW